MMFFHYYYHYCFEVPKVWSEVPVSLLPSELLLVLSFELPLELLLVLLLSLELPFVLFVASCDVLLPLLTTILIVYNYFILRSFSMINKFVFTKQSYSCFISQHL